MADRAAAERSTGYVIGGISPFGQRKRLPTVVDSSAMGWDRVLCSAGKRGWDVPVSPRTSSASPTRSPPISARPKASRVLNGKTMFISGASRGIGLAIAKRAAADGANIALIAKTAEPHPKLAGTVYTAAEEIEGRRHALPIVGDVRDGDSVAGGATTVEQFGGIDICVNNASAINLGSIAEVPLNGST